MDVLSKPAGKADRPLGLNDLAAWGLLKNALMASGTAPLDVPHMTVSQGGASGVDDVPIYARSAADAAVSQPPHPLVQRPVQANGGFNPHGGQMFYDPMFPPDKPTRLEKLGKGMDQAFGGLIQLGKTVQDAATGGHRYEDYTAQKKDEYAHYNAIRDPADPDSFDGYAALGTGVVLAPTMYVSRGRGMPAGMVNAGGQTIRRYPLLSAQGGRLLAQDAVVSGVASLIPFANNAQERLFNGMVGAVIPPSATFIAQGFGRVASQGLKAAKSAYPGARQQLVEFAQRLRGSPQEVPVGGAKGLGQGVPKAAVGQDRSAQLGLKSDAVPAGVASPVSAAASQRVGSNAVREGGREGYTTFYHGAPPDAAASIKKNGIVLSRGSAQSDFGQGFYMSRSREDAIWSGGRHLEKGEPVEVIEFRVPNSELDRLSTLDLGANMDLWRKYIAHHKNLGKRGVPKPDLPQGIPLHDVRTGPLYQDVRNGEVFPSTKRSPQTSIHTQRAVDLFNQYRVR